MNCIKWGKRILAAAVFFATIFIPASQPTHAGMLVSLADTPWPMFQHDNQHTGRSQYQGITGTPVKLWETTLYEGTYHTFDTGVSIGMDNNIYVGAVGTNAVNPISGDILWTYPSAGPDAPTVAGDGTLYFESNNSFVALYPDGTSPWVFEMNGNYADGSSPAIANDGKIYLAHDGLLSFFPYPQGDPLTPLNWIIPFSTYSHGSPAIGLDGILYYTNSSNLVAMHADGDILWSRGLYKNSGATPYIYDDPANPNDGTILVEGGDSNPSSAWITYAFGLDGTPKWSYDHTSKGPISNIAFSQDGMIYISHRRGFDALNPDGSLRYSKSDLGRISVDRLGHIYLCDISCISYDENGNLLWKTKEQSVWDAQPASFTAPVIAADGLLYVTTGQLPCLTRDIHCPGLLRIAAYADPAIYPTISSSESSLHSEIKAGKSLPPKTIQLTSSLHSVKWSAAVQPANTGWINISMAGGTTPGDLTLEFNTEGLLPGSYEATLSIAPVDEISSRIDIPVILDVAYNLSHQVYLPVVANGNPNSTELISHEYFLSYLEHNYNENGSKLFGIDRKGNISRLSYCGGGRISWSPDGEKFARSGSCPVVLYYSQIYTMTPDGKDYFEVTKFGDYFKDRPSWSPDGQLIAFFGADDPHEYRMHDIRVIKPDGTDMRVLTEPMDLASLTWSPDSSKIAFTASSRAYVMNADGSDRKMLGDSYYTWKVVKWSPDGTKILLERGRDPASSTYNSEIYVVNPDGSGLNNSTNHPAADTDPDWSPNGSRIVFIRDQGDNDQVYIMNSNGSGQTCITDQISVKTEPRWSPDGNYIAFVSGYNLIIMNINTRNIVKTFYR